MTLDMKHMAQAPAWDRIASSYAEVIASHLALFSADALRLADIQPGDAVLDVATGPGTLALQAARITQVDALDFSAEMLSVLRKRAEAEQVSLNTHVGDGQALPFESESFDAAFSMFGLFMFPDRARGFSELARVLKSGGRAVVASWHPAENVPAFALIGEELAREAGITEKRQQPLATAADVEREMSAAGFSVEVHDIEHTWSLPSFDALWDAMKRSHAALGVASDQLPPERFAQVLERIRARLQSALGDGPQNIQMSAWLGLGRLPGPRDRG